jgi:hypothetical protein
VKGDLSQLGNAGAGDLALDSPTGSVWDDATIGSFCVSLDTTRSQAYAPADPPWRGSVDVVPEASDVEPKDEKEIHVVF